MSNLPTADAAAIIDAFRDDLSSLLADSGVSYDRLRSTFMIAVQQYPDILKCTVESIRREISKCAADGLVPDGKEAILLPYLERDKDTNQTRYVANYQPMVYGIIKRMRDLGDVFQIVCRIVYAKDEFVLDEADPDTLSHKSDPFAKERGEIVGAYVVFRDDKGRVLHLETMSLEELEHVRNSSKSPDSPAYKKWKTEMFRKIVLRRGSKYISINNDKIRRLIERQDEMFEFQNSQRQVERFNPFAGGQTIDGQQHSALPSAGQRPMDPINGKPEGDFAHTRSDQREHAKQQQAPSSTKDSAKPKTELADKPHDLPDILIPPKDTDLLAEAASKILGVAMDESRDAGGRRGLLKQVATNWQGATPDYARDFLRSMIDAVDWTIQRDGAGQPWANEFSIFVHQTMEALGVEKLDLAKYPAAAPDNTAS